MKRRILPALLLIAMLCLPLLLAAGKNPDTTFTLLLRVKMAKAVDQGILDPDTGMVYAVSEPGFGTILLAAGTNHIYEAVIGQGIDSGETYTFSFRINNDVYETVTRTVTANPGTTEYIAWWNDDPINITTFRVDMTYMVMVNAFDPETDSMDITGTMNNWTGSERMERIDTTLVYSLGMPLDPGDLHKYKYRVNRDSLKTEFLDGPPRYFLVPDTFITLSQFFYDYNPATVPLTLMCDMRYQDESGNFDSLTEYVDVAGNFNNGGAWDLLYLRTGDSIHRTTLFFDTAMIGGEPLTFKFRINGDPSREELAGQPPRSYTLHAPTLSDPNRYFCWYDDINPNIPAPPWVTDLFIQGSLISGSTVTGSYSYHNLNGIPEGVSLYKWYKTDTIGAALVAIDSAWQVNYTIDSTLDIGQYLVFEVTPVAASGDSMTGLPARVYADWAVGGLGIGENERLQVKFYPNPAPGELHIESQEQSLSLSISDMYGRPLTRRSFDRPGHYSIPLEQLAPGTYVLHFYCPGKGFNSGKLIKL